MKYTNRSVVLLRPRHDSMVNSGHTGCLVNFLLRLVQIAVREVVENCVVEKHGILLAKSRVFSQRQGRVHDMHTCGTIAIA